MHNRVVVQQVRLLIQRIRHAQETRQRALLCESRRSLRGILRLRHLTTKQAIERIQLGYYSKTQSFMGSRGAYAQGRPQQRAC